MNDAISPLDSFFSVLIVSEIGTSRQVCHKCSPCDLGVHSSYTPACCLTLRISFLLGLPEVTVRFGGSISASISSGLFSRKNLLCCFPNGIPQVVIHNGSSLGSYGRRDSVTGKTVRSQPLPGFYPFVTLFFGVFGSVYHRETLQNS
jgi:hypothetical protein